MPNLPTLEARIQYLPDSSTILLFYSGRVFNCSSGSTLFYLLETLAGKSSKDYLKLIAQKGEISLRANSNQTSEEMQLLVRLWLKKDLERKRKDWKVEKEDSDSPPPSLDPSSLKL